MSSKEPNDFLAHLKRYFAPVAALLYLLAFVVRLKEYMDKLGWRVITIIVLLTSVLWAVYAWTAKRLTIVEPSSLVPKFARSVRVVSLLSVLLASIPAWFSLQPAQSFSIPTVAVRILNQKDDDVGIRRRGEFFITEPETPAMDRVVASGTVRLHRGGAESASDQSFTVPARGELALFAEFLNPAKFRPLLSAGGLSCRIVILQDDGQMLTKDGIPFDAEQLRRGYIELNIH